MGDGAVRKVGAIFVQPDSPKFLEREIQAEREVFDIAKVDAVSILDAYREHGANYSTAPFDPIGEKLRFYPGGFTIWSGFPGAGKTTLLRQLACHLMKPTDPTNYLSGSAVFVCSMEEMPQHVLVRHAEVACGTPDLQAVGLEWCAEVWQNKLHLWNYRPIEADAEHQKILAAIRVLAREKGVRHAIIDSLMCLDVASNDYEAQRLFAGALARTCHASGVHVHLVAHPRKPQQGGQKLELSEVAGSADLGRKADNVLFVKRAFEAETAVTFGPCTPMEIQVAKQRHNPSFIGSIDGWYHRKFRQFVLSQHQNIPTSYLPSAAEREIGGFG
jgi:KaiC/GvpD/RAD55 family RecA-like ATPase